MKVVRIDELSTMKERHAPSVAGRAATPRRRRRWRRRQASPMAMTF